VNAGTPGSYFERVGEQRYRPTEQMSGGWDPAELHFSPLAGLVVHAIEGHRADGAGGAGGGLLLSRLSFDILGRLATDDCDVEVETLRPGRTIELVEATVRIAGRAVIRARAWFLTAVQTGSIEGGGAERLPDPESLASWPMASLWPGRYVASLDVRPVRPPEPGRGTVWLSTGTELLAGEAVSPLASYLTLVDTANGIASRQPPTAWVFPNVDLTVHLSRQPEGRWVGLDTTVVFGPTGQGITSTVLHDLAGQVGTAQQMLTLRPVAGH
jgi:hypothetical protein